ncbi:hypothetical protein [Neobacillus sp. D3-1R]|uniref:hypothetical protein n=1 Tax=Neobacillus sp. D3-1R TaxID=3445778 RepID=UPI003F9EF00A
MLRWQLRFQHLENDLLDKGSQLILYSLTHNGDGLLRHPKEILQEQMPPSLNEKARLLFEVTF